MLLSPSTVALTRRTSSDAGASPAGSESTEAAFPTQSNVAGICGAGRCASASVTGGSSVVSGVLYADPVRNHTPPGLATRQDEPRFTRYSRSVNTTETGFGKCL